MIGVLSILMRACYDDILLSVIYLWRTDMAAKPLEAEYREQLATLLNDKKAVKVAEAWGVHRSTLAEAAVGLPKSEATRFLIRSKLDAKKVPV